MKKGDLVRLKDVDWTRSVAARHGYLWAVKGMIHTHGYDVVTCTSISTGHRARFHISGLEKADVQEG